MPLFCFSRRGDVKKTAGDNDPSGDEFGWARARSPSLRTRACVPACIFTLAVPDLPQSCSAVFGPEVKLVRFYRGDGKSPRSTGEIYLSGWWPPPFSHAFQTLLSLFGALHLGRSLKPKNPLAIGAQRGADSKMPRFLSGDRFGDILPLNQPWLAILFKSAPNVGPRIESILNSTSRFLKRFLKVVKILIITYF